MQLYGSLAMLSVHEAGLFPVNHCLHWWILQHCDSKSGDVKADFEIIVSDKNKWI